MFSAGAALQPTALFTNIAIIILGLLRNEPELWIILTEDWQHRAQGGLLIDSKHDPGSIFANKGPQYHHASNIVHIQARQQNTAQDMGGDGFQFQ